MSERHTVVVGGGIVGASATYFLAARGARVTLLDRDDAGESASAGNAGLIALGHGPLPKPGRTTAALRWMADGRSPLYIAPRFDPALIRWLWRFHRAGRRDRYERSLDLLARHGRPAGDCFRALVEAEKLDCEYRPIGRLEVFATEAGRAAASEELSALDRHGYAVTLLDGDALRAREPAFRDHVRGAALFEDSAFANPGAFLSALTARAADRGADVRSGVSVERLRVENGACVGVETTDGERVEADEVVLAAGIWSSALAARAGAHLPMQAAKGYHLNLTPPDPSLRTACVLAERFVAVTPMNGGLRLAGTLEFSGINDRIRPKRVEMLRRGAESYLHGIEGTRERSRWCGLRPCTADGLPVLGWAAGVGHLFIATGHAMMGFALGPLAGRLVAESLLDGRPSLPLEDMRADRFA